jgi:hypothetical protein
MKKFKCTGCGELKQRIFVEGRKQKTWYKYKGKKEPRVLDIKIHKDETGRLWHYNSCPDCVYLAHSKRDEARGKSSPRSRSHKFPNIRKAFDSEQKVKELFQSLGFAVKQTKGKGPDLVCTLGDLCWKVEVKSAIVEKRHKKETSYCVGGITKARTGDDLIAIVFPFGIYVNQMSKHLERCRKPHSKDFGAGSRSANDYKKALMGKVKDGECRFVGLQARF